VNSPAVCTLCLLLGILAPSALYALHVSRERLPVAAGVCPWPPGLARLLAARRARLRSLPHGHRR